MSEWRRVHHAPGYEVSDEGRVRSWLPARNGAKPPVTPRLLRMGRDKDGYAKVRLYIGSRAKDLRVCALVAEAWHGARPEGLVVRHLDGSKANDKPGNLVWGTPQENSDDSIAHGTWVHGEQVNTAKLTEADVVAIKRSPAGHSELARQYGVTPGAIWHIRAGRSWKHVAG